MADCTGYACIKGPCGDTMAFWVQIDAGYVRKVSFTTDGCASSLACGSMTSSLALHDHLDEVLALEPQDILDALGRFPEESSHCALLACSTLKAACHHHLQSTTNTESTPTPAPVTSPKKAPTMLIAIPVSDNTLAMHFGHCETFALMRVNQEEKRLISRHDVQAPPHQPGLLPVWLAEKGVSLVIAGGMGQRAIALFEEQQIEVLIGAPALTPDELVEAYLEQALTLGQNVCDH